jgi:hypothetical protein
MVAAVLLALAGSYITLAQGRGQAAPQPIGFFVTSVGIGRGGDLGGLADADAHCAALAAAVGRGSRTWRAYLSTQARPGQPAVNARDRIRRWPWYNSTHGRAHLSEPVPASRRHPDRGTARQ